MTISLRDAAARLGVHYQTAYKWVRDGALPARKVGASYLIAEDDLTAFESARGAGRPAPEEIRVRDWAARAGLFTAALLAGDERTAAQVVTRLRDGGIPLLDLVERVITPALAQVGDGWAAGEVAVAAEHRASAICERVLADLSRPVPGRPRGTVVVATPPDERHALPALMAACVLREDRWRVHHLGADMPADDLADFAVGAAADLVVLSVTSPAGAAAATRAADALAARELTVLTGRPGASLRELLAQARGD